MILKRIDLCLEEGFPESTGTIKRAVPISNRVKNSRLCFKGTAILLYRFGSDNAVNQFTHSKLPERFKRGVWAFPYPYMDEFFTIHRVDSLLKKRARYRIDPLRRSSEVNPSYDQEIARIDQQEKRRMYKRTLSTFWWDKPFLSRLGSGGNPDCVSVENWWLWENAKVWAETANSVLPSRKNMFSKDHLEIFCPMKGNS